MPVSSGVVEAVERFNDAVNRQDTDQMMASMTADCVFESTQPPDGDRHEGPAEVCAFFQRLFDNSIERTFDVEEIIESHDRVVVRWIHHWIDNAGNPGHVRGVDVFRVRGGKVAEKLSYVKG